MSRKIKAAIREYLSSVGIEYFAVLDYKDVRVTAPSIMEREGFTPRSIILFLVPYYGGECENISRYAASLDYHIFIRRVASGLIERLRALAPEGSYAGFGDHSPVDERHAALIGGLGILGDSGLIINEKYGSYVFIGDVITDLTPEDLGTMPPRPMEYCCHCGACHAACPTGALRGEGCDCLSAITQRKGELADFEVALMRKYNTVWGCDLCQSSCPHNSEPIFTPISFFYENRIERLDEDSLAALDKPGLRERAFGWRGRGVLERNIRETNKKQ